jgi:hypothetical protein
MPHRILNFIDDHVPQSWKLSIYTFLASLTVFDILDWTWRCITGVLTITLFIYARRRQLEKMKTEKLEQEKLDLEIYQLMQKNKGK